MARLPGNPVPRQPDREWFAMVVFRTLDVDWLARNLTESTLEDWGSMDVGDQTGWRDMAVRLKQRMVAQ